jgi:hypothetical protein
MERIKIKPYEQEAPQPSEQKREVKKEEEKFQLVIVDELQKQPIREAETEEGKVILMTKDEALAEIVVNTRELLRRL